MIYTQIVSRSIAKKIGIKLYFNGSSCKYGHIDYRFTINSDCVSCYRIRKNISVKPILTKEEVLKKIEEQKARRAKTKKDWYIKNKDLSIKRAAEWKKRNPEKVKDSWAKWRKKDKSKAITFMRDSLRRVLKVEKNGRTESILGYSRVDLRNHIQKQFLRGMTWENHGEWHIDHITPISIFLEQGIYDPRVINCLTNLKPVWASDNLKKHNKIEFLI